MRMMLYTAMGDIGGTSSQICIPCLAGHATLAAAQRRYRASRRLVVSEGPATVGGSPVNAQTLDTRCSMEECDASS
jgi:hypothetical protein